MSADRLRSELPSVVTAVVGMVVAVVSGVFGISAHGLAAPGDMGPVTAGQLLTVAATSAGVGAVTAALARYRPPIFTAAVGLVCGQGAVHLAMSSGHSHSTGAPHGVGIHTVDPAVVRTAMDDAALDPLASAAALLSPVMVAAHIAAIVFALLVIAVLAGALAWLSARAFPPPVIAHLSTILITRATGRSDTSVKQYLLSRGGTRAPPVAV
ncbi:hypothetical protein FQ137_02775 [Dietzia sp. ANT_WB102]|nr:hypothetical protein FQ137_02775 [Dietzia sp. ANT_WB102]